MTDTHNMQALEGALKEVFDKAPNAKGFFVSIIDENQEAQTLFAGEDAAADAMLALQMRYVADKQEVNVFDKLLEVQTKLMRVHPEEFKAYAEKLQTQFEQEET